MDCDNLKSSYDIFLEIIRLHYHRAYMLLDKINMYPGQPAMLFALQKEDGQSQTELAEKLNIKPATVTVMLNRMEKSKIVERRQDPNDQRISRVYITEKGRGTCRELEEIKATIESECLANFTLEEQVLLRRLLMQVRDNLIDVCDRELEI